MAGRPVRSARPGAADRSPTAAGARHWVGAARLQPLGDVEAEVVDGRLVALHPLDGDPDPSPIAQNLLDAVDHPLRIRRPAVRRGFLDEVASGERGRDRLRRRGAEPFVEAALGRGPRPGRGRAGPGAARARARGRLRRLLRLGLGRPLRAPPEPAVAVPEPARRLHLEQQLLLLRRGRGAAALRGRALVPGARRPHLLRPARPARPAGGGPRRPAGQEPAGRERRHLPPPGRRRVARAARRGRADRLGLAAALRRGRGARRRVAADPARHRHRAAARHRRRAGGGGTRRRGVPRPLLLRRRPLPGLAARPGLLRRLGGRALRGARTSASGTWPGTWRPGRRW